MEEFKEMKPTELDEGKVYFDIIFYVRTKDRVSQTLVNIEAQRSANPGYHIKNRAIYYTSRMISPQKGAGRYV